MANPVMETVTFRLLPGTDSAAFLAAARATALLVAACPGFVARHLTCDEDGTWTDLVEWTSAGAAHAAAAALMADPVFQPFVAMIDGASARMRHPAILWRMA